MSDADYRKIKLNTIANYAYFFIYAATNFILNPILVKYIGSSDFGIWKACIRVFEFASFSDGRSSQALKWVVARNNDPDGSVAQNKAVGSAVTIWISFLPLCIATVLITAYCLPYLIADLSLEEFKKIRVLGLFLGANILVVPLFEIPNAILVGTNNSYRSKPIQIFWLVISNAAMLYVVSSGYGMLAMAEVMVLCALFNAISIFVLVKYTVGWLGYVKPTKKEVKIFFSFSSGVLVWTVVDKLLISSEMLLIVVLAGSSDVTKYIFTSFMAQFGLSVVLLIGSSVMPYLGTLISEKKDAELSLLLLVYRDSILAIVTIISACILAFNMSFVALWAGPEFYIGSIFNLLVVLSFIQVAYIRSHAQIHDLSMSINKRVFYGFVLTVLSLLLAGVIFLLGGRVLESVIIGLLIGRLGLNMILLRTVLQMTALKPTGLSKYLAAIFILIFSYTLGNFLLLTSWYMLILSMLPVVVILCGMCFILLLTSDTKAIVYRRLNVKMLDALK